MAGGSSILSWQPRPLRAQLSRGILSLDIQQSASMPELMFSVAEPLKAAQEGASPYALVSKITGQHVPSRPSKLRDSSVVLADLLPHARMPGPVLIVGVSESGVSLAGCLYQAIKAYRDDVVFLPTTRQHLNGAAVLTDIKMPGADNPVHRLYQPQHPESAARVRSARSLVVVDSDLYTGDTVKSIYQAFQAIPHPPSIEHVVAATLTNWMGDGSMEGIEVDVTTVALVTGRTKFVPTPFPVAPAATPIKVENAYGWQLFPSQDWGRLGSFVSVDSLIPNLEVAPGENVLVVGTGEYVLPPFWLAERLENKGVNALFVTATPTPFALGNAIKSTATFADNYGEGIPHFLYNVSPGDYDRIILCAETPAPSAEHLAGMLNAELVVNGRLSARVSDQHSKESSL